jgi:hypothetical protein
MSETEGNSVIYSATDVINLYLNLKRLSPDLNEWNEKHLSENPPRYYRYLQLRVLFDVYSLGDFDAFEKGEFIKNHQLQEFNIVVEKANQFINKNSPELYKWISIKIEDLRLEKIMGLFEDLFSYRIKLNTVIEHNKGVIECSGLSRYAFDLSNQLNFNIKKELYKIDDVLSLIISPAEKTFSVDELASKYGFPLVDIEEIDADWM